MDGLPGLGRRVGQLNSRRLATCFFVAFVGLANFESALFGQQPSQQSAFQPGTASNATIRDSQASNSQTSSAAVSAEPLPLSAESIQVRLRQAQSDPAMSVELKQALTQAYEAALTDIRSKQEEEKRFKELATNAELAPQATLETRRKKENPAARDLISESALRTYSLQALQALLQTQQTNYQTALDGRMKAESAIVTREGRRKELPKIIAEQKTIIQKLVDDASLPLPDSTESILREAIAIQSRAKFAAASERLRKLEQESRAYEAESELLPLKKEVFAADERYYQLRLKEINEELNKRRETKIEEEKAKAESVAASAPAELRPFSDRLVSRAQAWLDLAKKNTAIQLEIENAKAQHKFWEERYQIMINRSDVMRRSGFSMINNWNGLLLRRHRNELPDETKLHSQLNQNVSRIQQTETLIIELEDWKNQTSATQLEEIRVIENADFQGPDLSSPNLAPLNGGSPDLTPGTPLRLSPSNFQYFDRLMAVERELVSNFAVDAVDYSDHLFELSDTKQKTIQLVQKYRNFIDQHILWIRSANPFGRLDLRQVWPAMHWMLEANHWSEAGLQFLYEIRNRPWETIAVFAAWSVLIFRSGQIRRSVSVLGEQASRSTNLQFTPTLQAAILTVLLASPWVLLFVYIGYRLVSATSPQPFPNALGMAMLASSRYFLPLEILRQVCRSGGLAERHFEWSDSVSRLLRKNLRWLIDLGVPSIAIVSLFFNTNQDRYENGLGRLAFATVMILASLFLFIVLRPKQGVFAAYLNEHPGGWADRLRYVWYLGVAFGPLFLCVNSLMGYHYTAVRLSMHWHTTVVALIGLLLLYQLMRRWLLLSRRKIIADQARLRLEQVQMRDPFASTTPSSGSATGREMTGVDLASSGQSVDLAEINAQTMRLITSSLVVAAVVAVAYIWSGVLPAVNVLDSIVPWQVQGDKPGELVPITLGNILLSIPIVVLMYVAARNLPGLLEIAILQHLPIENAVRYAVSTVSRYLIVLVGIIWAFYYLGVRWANVQWLVAALGVGLGFGLQEIFANFISGLILLFEQPIRVGDIITLGDTTGSVSKIRVRATTITNFDRQELIIPNKDLITGRLLNWTLSDTTNRVVVNIGVAYGTDTDQACQLIQQICLDHPNVMTDPPPTAHFEGFQDSSLLIKVRFFLASLDQRLPTIHDIHTKIHHQFAEHHIEIPYPRRDVRIRESVELRVKS